MWPIFWVYLTEQYCSVMYENNIISKFQVYHCNCDQQVQVCSNLTFLILMKIPKQIWIQFPMSSQEVGDSVIFKLFIYVCVKIVFLGMML